ncbi:hypothetical protein AP3564_14450 [Aeribacillus pallidus]|uniref:Uncharacterized protein n=1 Tax=Aeribacillus pallidus TaxID=33936 RepID=A0A223E7N1_9BACI|nr:hypothetical protein AP3564_14450 [Aeribacillus pallidus]
MLLHLVKKDLILAKKYLLVMLIFAIVAPIFNNSKLGLSNGSFISFLTTVLFVEYCKLSLYFGTKEPFFCTFLQKALSPFLKECAKFFVNYFGRENPSVHRRGRRT